MRKFTFRGGVHPYEGKELTAEKPVRVLEAGAELTFLLSQHIGAPARAVVAAGEHVKRGQRIAEPAQGLSVGIHASIDGKVTEVTERHIVIAAE